MFGKLYRASRAASSPLEGEPKSPFAILLGGLLAASCPPPKPKRVLAPPQGGSYRLWKHCLVPMLASLLLASPAHATERAACLPTTIERHSVSPKEPASVKLALETATTPEQYTRGLMGRHHLAPCEGMAFLFPRAMRQRFWMKDTPLPLDLLFVDESQRIIYIGHGTPLSEEPIGPDAPVRSVIEIASGRAAKDRIAVGDTVHYETASFPASLAR